MTSLTQHSANTLGGGPVELSTYAGKVLLVMNVASACGLTPHYTGLQKLHDEFAGKGFSVLGFPCNQFGAQEPGNAEQIREFCSTKYRVTFPMFDKVEVKKGPGQHAVYQFLTEAHAEPNWNFTKYLVGRDGQVLKRFEPTTAPDDPALRAAIESALAS